MPTNRATAGYTFLEVLVALFIIAILSIISLNFLSWTAKEESQITAKDAAKALLDQLAGMVANDVQYIADPNIRVGISGASTCYNYNATASTCLWFPITRNDTAQVNYTVTYKNSCQTIPSSLSAVIPSSFGTAGSCIALMGCAAGKYPQIEVDNSPSGASPQYFPDLNKFKGRGVTQNVLGAAACLIDNATEKITTLHIDAAILDAKKAIKIISMDRFIMGANNVNKQIKLLPPK